MTKPDDIPQWAWDEAGRVFCELFSVHSEVYQEESWSLDREHIARALLTAEQRGMERASKVADYLYEDWRKKDSYAGLSARVIRDAIRTAAREIER